MIFNFLDNLSLDTVLKSYEEGYVFVINNGHADAMVKEESDDE